MGLTSGETPRGILPHLVVKLKAGWRYDDAQEAFVQPDHARRGDRAETPIAVRDKLPREARIVHTVPDLASADPQSLSEDERDLARYVQVIFPAGAAVAEYLAVFRGLPCTEEARLPPEVSLPQS